MLKTNIMECLTWINLVMVKVLTSWVKDYHIVTKIFSIRIFYDNIIDFKYAWFYFFWDTELNIY